MRTPSAREPACLGFDHGAEVVAAPSALLLQILSDLVELLLGQRFVQQTTPSGGSPRRVGIEREPCGVRRQHRASGTPQDHR